jgi:hypothetical protein
LQNVGAFWSLSCGADYAKCIRELGGLYDRALRYHAFRVGVAVSSSHATPEAISSDARLKGLSAACDRALVLTERKLAAQGTTATEPDDDSAEAADSTAEIDEAQEGGTQNEFYLRSPDVWESVLAAILTRR